MKPITKKIIEVALTIVCVIYLIVRHQARAPLDGIDLFVVEGAGLMLFDYLKTEK